MEQAIPPIATHFSVAWSVCLSSVTFVHPAETVRVYMTVGRFISGSNESPINHILFQKIKKMKQC